MNAAPLAAAVLVVTALTQGSAIPHDACAILRQGQVSAALGVRVEPGQHLVPKDSLVCGWAPAGGPTIGGKKVTVTIMTAQSFATGKTPVNGITKTPVAGVADDAYYITTPGFGTAVNVKAATLYYQIRVGGFSEDQEKAIEKQLAIAVTGNVFGG